MREDLNIFRSSEGCGAFGEDEAVIKQVRRVMMVGREKRGSGVETSPYNSST